MANFDCILYATLTFDLLTLESCPCC